MKGRYLPLLMSFCYHIKKEKETMMCIRRLPSGAQRNDQNFDVKYYCNEAGEQARIQRTVITEAYASFCRQTSLPRAGAMRSDERLPHGAGAGVKPVAHRKKATSASSARKGANTTTLVAENAGSGRSPHTRNRAYDCDIPGYWRRMRHSQNSDTCAYSRQLQPPLV